MKEQLVNIPTASHAPTAAQPVPAVPQPTSPAAAALTDPGAMLAGLL